MIRSPQAVYKGRLARLSRGKGFRIYGTQGTLGVYAVELKMFAGQHNLPAHEVDAALKEGIKVGFDRSLNRVMRGKAAPDEIQNLRGLAAKHDYLPADAINGALQLAAMRPMLRNTVLELSTGRLTKKPPTLADRIVTAFSRPRGKEIELHNITPPQAGKK